MKRIAKSAKSVCGCSYKTHIILAASIADPPPRAMITSGWKLAIASAPFLASDNNGSG